MIFVQRNIIVTVSRHLSNLDINTIIMFYSTVHECANLPPMDPNGLADPYVNLSLIDEKGHSVSQTKKSEIKRKTLDPVFGESFIL